MTKQERKEIKKVVKYAQEVEHSWFSFWVCNSLNVDLFSWPEWADEVFFTLDGLVITELKNSHALERRDLYLSALLSELTLND